VHATNRRLSPINTVGCVSRTTANGCTECTLRMASCSYQFRRVRFTHHGQWVHGVHPTNRRLSPINTVGCVSRTTANGCTECTLRMASCSYQFRRVRFMHHGQWVHGVHPTNRRLSPINTVGCVSRTMANGSTECTLRMASCSYQFRRVRFTHHGQWVHGVHPTNRRLSPINTVGCVSRTMANGCIECTLRMVSCSYQFRRARQRHRHRAELRVLRHNFPISR